VTDAQLWTVQATSEITFIYVLTEFWF